MTAKEKAEELFNMFIIIDDLSDSTGNSLYFNAHAKQCALIAVDEILKAVDNPDETYLMKHSVEYWSQVKQEVERL